MSDYENILDYFPFEAMRPGQEDVLLSIRKHLLNPKIRYILLEAATGSGKSCIGITAAKASESAYVATANKFLQNQYMRDFDDVLVDLKGRSNYRCKVFDVPDGLKDKIGEFYNCVNSPCQSTKDGRKKCAGEAKCEYHQQLEKASSAQITSFNFASALAFLNYMKKHFFKRELLICDECHNIPNWITQFVSIDFSLSLLKELGLKDRIPDYENVRDYKEYLESAQDAVKENLAYSEVLESDVVEKLETLQRKFRVFDEITKKKTEMSNFVVEKIWDLRDGKTISKISFKPVVINTLVDDYLFSHASKVILMSATILDFPTYMDLMGIPQEECAVIKVPSSFPVVNRPIYTNVSVGYLNQKTLDVKLPQIVETLRMLLHAYPNVKGIIHGVTYKICDFIYDNLDSDRLLYAKSAYEQNQMVERHAKTEDPTILLSPSMTEGVDLFDDLSRFQILVKMPYAYLGDPVLRRRMEIYPNYYNMLTALTVTQAYGRGVRNAFDKCHFYILDMCFSLFVQNHRDILQQSFLEAVC